jgi:hypothetical protein
MSKAMIPASGKAKTLLLIRKGDPEMVFTSKA